MASLRRTTTPLNDPSTAKFLYTILKQLDHKAIDWTLVASELEITNGHAARMRFSRFKQHMEGTVPTVRKSRTEKHTQRKVKLERKRTKIDKSKLFQKDDAHEILESKAVDGTAVGLHHRDINARVKDEVENNYILLSNSNNNNNNELMLSATIGSEMRNSLADDVASFIKPEPKIKDEMDT